MLTFDTQTYQALLTFFKSSGMPKSMAGVLAYLLVCEPPQQSASSIEAGLGLSKGSVNTALNALQRARLVTRVRPKGGRHLEYQLDKRGWEQAVAYRIQSIQTVLDIADQGMASNPNNTRLREMRAVYDNFFQHFKHLRTPKPPTGR